jgi:hypothetical protein
MERIVDDADRNHRQPPNYKTRCNGR